jgi:ABC-type nitrate/sulfonate/bicarbonate transport system permease component
MTKKYSLVIGPFLVLLIWFLITQFSLIDPIFLSSPISTFSKLYLLFLTGNILTDIGHTMLRWFIGLALGTVIGIPLGIFMGISKKIYESLEVIVDFSRSIPVMTLFPLALVLFGIGDRSKIALAAWASLLYVVINTMYGVRHVKQARIMMAKSLRARKGQIFTKVILPDALPEIFVGIRMSISMSLVIVVASEMIMGTNVGLGKRIFDAAMVYKISEMYATILVAGLLGYASNKLFVLLENRVIHWAGM